MNEARVGVGEDVPTTELLVGAGEDVGEDVAPQAARPAALAITSAVRWIRMECFPSSFGVCLLNDHLFVWVTRLTRSRARYGNRRPTESGCRPGALVVEAGPMRMVHRGRVVLEDGHLSLQVVDEEIRQVT